MIGDELLLIDNSSIFIVCVCHIVYSNRATTKINKEKQRQKSTTNNVTAYRSTEKNVTQIVLNDNIFNSHSQSIELEQTINIQEIFFIFSKQIELNFQSSGASSYHLIHFLCIETYNFIGK